MVKNLDLKKLFRELTFRSYSLIKPRYAIIEVYFDPLNEKYTHEDRVNLGLIHHRKRKHQRKEKTLHQYSIVGKCVAFHKRGINSSFTLRNVINLIPFEMTFAFFTLAISALVIRNHFIKPKRFKYKRSSRYELRVHSPAKSQSTFEYMLD